MESKKHVAEKLIKEQESVAQESDLTNDIAQGTNYLRLATAQLERKNYPLALDLFNEVLHYMPNEPHVLVGHATAAARTGHFEKARESVLKALSIDNAHLSALDLLAEIEHEVKEQVSPITEAAFLSNLTFIAVTETYNLALVANSIDGFLTHRQGAALHLCASNGPGKGEIVEIGSFKGRSTVWLAHGSRSVLRETVTAIDPHLGSPEHQPGGELEHRLPESGSTFEEFTENIERSGLTKWVNPKVMSSEEAALSWTKPVRLLFIDGNHSFEMVEKDFLNWEPFVVKNGLILFHDVYRNGNGPGLVVEQYIEQSDRFKKIGYLHGMYIAQKIS